MRLIDRLRMQVERVPVANQLTVVTKDVVEITGAGIRRRA